MSNARKLDSGNYRARVTFTNPDGTRSYKSFTAPTKKEAEMLAAQYNLSRKEHSKSDLTLKEAGERYIESKRNVLSPSTIRGYVTIINNYTPELFSFRLQDITQERVQCAINAFARKNSPKTCRNLNGFVSAVISTYAPEIGRLKITLPPNQKSEIYVPDTEEVREIERLVKGTINEVPVFLAAECGLRASEIAGLKVKNITNDYIYIKTSIVPDENNKPCEKAPKSFSGTRKIPITAEICKYLKSGADGERVCNRTDTNISNNWWIFRTSHNLAENLTFHALRHHFASKCLLMGMPQKYIAELMGHADTTMIEKIYQHTFPSAMAAFAEQLRAQYPPNL